MNAQLRRKTPDRRVKKRAAAPRRPDGAADNSGHDVDIVRMATAEAAARNAARRAMIAETAYYRAEKRGFEPGHEVEDWLAAETEIAHVLSLSEFLPAESVVTGSRP